MSESKKLKKVETIPFNDAVTEGKKIVAETNRRERESGYRLGQLADSVEPKYRDQTLAKFAKAIGIASCTLARHRSVYRAWKDFEAPGPVSYSVMRELQDHPDRYAAVADNPRMTKAEARKLMGKEKPPCKPRADFAHHSNRWFAGVYKLANDVIRETANTEMVTSEAIEFDLVPTLREAGEALLALVDRLQPNEIKQLAA